LLRDVSAAASRRCGSPVEWQIRQLLESHELKGRMRQRVVTAVVHVLESGKTVEKLLCEDKEV
jgi:hypothetical protein